MCMNNVFERSWHQATQGKTSRQIWGDCPCLRPSVQVAFALVFERLPLQTLQCRVQLCICDIGKVATAKWLPEATKWLLTYTCTAVGLQSVVSSTARPKVPKLTQLIRSKQTKVSTHRPTTRLLKQNRNPTQLVPIPCAVCKDYPWV